ncbi:hypothetical protein acsn021_09660 [Anaerocolumna cellulosilytica]|uniref:Uncharacterized protein n=1 Tax=Anaerocolumna cellulosilytica TaxID=433286 RepID=A0A6S6QZX6_9FIRM|nr:C39 family peptidase [Anaerocolumna cellulosilytica]MBB5194452.1 hypothetical protein [Anaerocolumna cellulosilytica]BCJ93397.1 hypothetical protein acsn021_09660 [Anaerocolumna cellulosilytica]
MRKKQKFTIFIICILLIGITGFGYAITHKTEVKNQLRRFQYFIELSERKNEVPEYKVILKNYNKYPTDLLQLALDNVEAVEFVKDYINEKDKSIDINLIDDFNYDNVPLLIQWDKRWGYSSYGDNIIGINGCGPTCMSMVYTALTGDVSMNPKAMSEFCMESGFYNENGTIWTFMTEGARILGIYSREAELNEEGMIKELDNNHLIILSMKPGDFTQSGHFIVITGYDNNTFSIHDPNSILRSNKAWDYNTLKNQTKKMWIFSADTM